MVSPAESRDALDAFKRAIETGDIQSLLDVLAPEVVLLTDGGGIVQAALEPVVGAEQVAGFLARVNRAVSLESVQINGYPALIIRRDGEVNTVMALQIEDGLVTRFWGMLDSEAAAKSRAPE